MGMANDIFLAYIDPGTGAIVLQVVVASVIGFIAVFRRYLFTPVLTVIGKLRGRSGDATDTEKDGPV